MSQLTIYLVVWAFYDISLRFPEINVQQFFECDLGRLISSTSSFDLVARELITSGAYTMRDIIQYYDAINSVRDMHYTPISEADNRVCDLTFDAVVTG